jgi:Lon protease-like protein
VNICVDPLFPQGNLSLHMFEPRYKLMMQRIVNNTRAFSYVAKLDGFSAQVGDVALRARLQDVEFQSGSH